MPAMASRKSIPMLVRAAGKLTNAGGYDPLANCAIVDTEDYDSMEIRVHYAPDAATVNGQCEMRFYVASQQNGTFYPRTVDDGSVNVVGDESYSNCYVSAKRMFVDTNGNATYILDVSDARFVRIPFAEVGDTVHPGIVTADCVLGAEE